MNDDQQIRILIVDDTRTSRFILKRMLPQNEYQLFEAHDGKSALSMVEAIQPDIVFMDLQMPDMTGLECSQRIKENRRSRQTRIIMVTAESRLEKMSEAYRIGCNDYITKPINKDELSAKLTEVVRFVKVSRSIREVTGSGIPKQLKRN